MPVELWPLMQHRMDVLPHPAAASGGAPRSSDGARARTCWPRSPTGAPPPPATSTTACRAPRSTGAGTGRRPARCLDYLYMIGEVAIAGRNSQFEVRLRPARAGAARRRAGARRRRRSRRPTASSSAGPRGRTASRPPSCLRRLLPDAAPADAGDRAPGRDRRPRRGGRAAPGADRGLEAAGLPPPRRPAAAPGRRPGAAQPVRPGGVGAGAHRAALRLPLPDRDLRARPTSGCTATTCCRSCSATGSSAGSTSRPTGQPGALLVQGGVRRARGAAARPPRSSPPSCAGWPAGSGSTTIVGRAAGRPGAAAASRRIRWEARSHRWVEWRRTLAQRPPQLKELTARACHSRQDPPHRRGQDPPPARGDRQGGQRHRGRLRRDERRRAAGHDRRVQGAARQAARPSTT